MEDTIENEIIRLIGTVPESIEKSLEGDSIEKISGTVSIKKKNNNNYKKGNMIDRNEILEIVMENVINNSTPIKGGTDRVISFDSFIDNMTNNLVKKLKKCE
jgi:hypothetical protein